MSLLDVCYILTHMSEEKDTRTEIFAVVCREEKIYKDRDTKFDIGQTCTPRNTHRYTSTCDKRK